VDITAAINSYHVFPGELDNKQETVFLFCCPTFKQADSRRDKDIEGFIFGLLSQEARIYGRFRWNIILYQLPNFLLGLVSKTILTSEATVTT
jgi:hypothetical protein